jgi:O-6-methylguanine DNA methyltransferase
MYYSTQYRSPVGGMLLASDGEGIIGLWNEGQKYYGAGVKGERVNADELPVLTAAKVWLDRYFAGEKPQISELRLNPGGSEFRKEVWNLLCEIPYGSYTTYGELAKKMAVRMDKESMSSQAVGGAVGHNPISVIIPCHRVVGTNGSLTGYAGGITKKIALLEHEGARMQDLFVPVRGTAL